MLEAKKILNKMITDVDKAVTKFIKKNQDSLREIMLWGGYHATDDTLSLKAFGIEKGKGGFDRVYQKKEKYSIGLIGDVCLTGKFNSDYANIVIHPDFSYEFSNHTIVNPDETTLCKEYCTLYKLLPILQKAELNKIIIPTPLSASDEARYKNNLNVIFTNESCAKISHIKSNSNPGHWAHGDVYYTFIYDNQYIVDVEAYDSEAYCSMRSNQIRALNFLYVYDLNGKFLTSLSDIPVPGFDSRRRSIIGKIDLDDVMNTFF